MILNSTFEDAVVVNTDETFENCTFAYSTGVERANLKKGAPNTTGLSINGAANVSIKNCDFNVNAYSSVFMNSTGDINIDNCRFDCTKVYNPVEGGSGSSTAKLTKVSLSGNVFDGICGNNYINVYNVEDGAVIDIKDTLIRNMSQQAECVRLSNLANNAATFNIDNLSYSYDMSTDYDENWTKMILLQDYTNGSIQDFTKYTINISNIECNGEKVADKDDFKVGGLMVVYDQYKSADGTNQMITETNQPVVNFN